MFISILYMFRAAMCPSSVELLYQCGTWFVSLCVDYRLVCRSICSISTIFSFMFISILYMFQAAMCPSSVELFYQCATWFVSLCVDYRLVCRRIWSISTIFLCLFLFSTCFRQPCAHLQLNYFINAAPCLCHSV